MHIGQRAILAISEHGGGLASLEILLPGNDHAEEFLRLYGTEHLHPENIFREELKPAQRLVIAIASPGEQDTVTTMIVKVKEEGWQLASIDHWSFYQKIKGCTVSRIAIMGTIYRDEEFCEQGIIVEYGLSTWKQFVYTIFTKQLRELYGKKIPILLVKKYGET